jgi:hypothetical protein
MARQDMAKHNVFVVAPGISTHGIRGIIDQGKEVTPDDLEGGKAAFDELVRREVIVAKQVDTPPPAPEPPAPAAPEPEPVKAPDEPPPAAPPPVTRASTSKDKSNVTKS